MERAAQWTKGSAGDKGQNQSETTLHYTASSSKKNNEYFSSGAARAIGNDVDA